MILKTRLVSISLLILISLGSLFFINQYVSGEENKVVEEELKDEIESIVDGNEDNISVFIGTKDGDIEINEDKVFSSASTIKVPILIEALRQAEKGQINLDEKTTVSSSDITNGGGIIRHLSDDQILSIRDLMYLMIILSDNTATNMMIDRVGMDSVNKACVEMGCEDTKLQRKMMESVKPKDNLTTAKDMGRIMKEAYEGDILNAEGKKEFLRIMGDQKLSTNLPAYKDRDAHKGVEIFHKGGSLGSTKVRHDIGMFTYNDDVVYVSVLTENVSKKTAQTTMAQIGETIMDYLVE